MTFLDFMMRWAVEAYQSGEITLRVAVATIATVLDEYGLTLEALLA